MNDWLPPDFARSAIAGLAGSYVAIATSPFKGGWRVAALRLSSGTLTAGYFGPAVSKMISPITTSLEPATALGLSAFLVGVSGMTLVTFVLDLIVARRAGVIARQRDLETEVLPATRSAQREAVAAQATEASDAH